METHIFLGDDCELQEFCGSANRMALERPQIDNNSIGRIESSKGRNDVRQRHQSWMNTFSSTQTASGADGGVIFVGTGPVGPYD
ncbi:cytochrome CBB3 [Anopheles sinensis]|uniref:Cytochrome CBB3 n=1 Tax=Anopheles sinensis TaxID=74873 RepID=A0A084WE32_ANOSI|nr:cytochrome CBB3 [Anopheles sinensis]